MDIKKIREEEAAEFQKNLRNIGSSLREPAKFEINGIDYIVNPGVFPSYAAEPATILNRNLGACNSDRVLDMFTGFGLHAVTAAKNGADYVVAVDSSRSACDNAEENVRYHDLGQTIVKHGHLFEPVNEKFDLIIANPPFGNRCAGTDLEKAMNDEGYRTLIEFWESVGDYLNPKGRIRTVFSDIGDMDFFYNLAKDNRFKCRKVVEGKFGYGIRIKVDDFTPCK